MYNQKQFYDDLVFNRYQGKYYQPEQDTDYQQLADHLNTRFQLDFYPGQWQVQTDGHNLQLINHEMIDNDLIESPLRASAAVPIHVQIVPNQLALPLLKKQAQSKVQTIYTIITQAQHTMHQHASRARLERILETIHQVLDYTPMIKQINQMYQQTIIKQTIILDTGLSTQPLTSKGISYLKSNFRQFYQPETDRLYVTNSHSALGDTNLAITPFDIGNHKLSAHQFEQILNSQALTKTQQTTIQPLSFDLQQIGYQKINWTKQPIHWLTPLKTWEKPITTTTSASSPTTQTTHGPAANEDLIEYNTPQSVTDVIKRHTNPRNTWDSHVVITHLPKK